MCDISNENEWRIFDECSHAESVWRAAALWSLIWRHVEEADGFKECFLNIFNDLQEGPKKLFAMMLWCIWKRRNNKVWDDAVKPVSISIN